MYHTLYRTCFLLFLGTLLSGCDIWGLEEVKQKKEEAQKWSQYAQYTDEDEFFLASAPKSMEDLEFPSLMHTQSLRYIIPKHLTPGKGVTFYLQMADRTKMHLLQRMESGGGLVTPPPVGIMSVALQEAEDEMEQAADTLEDEMDAQNGTIHELLQELHIYLELSMLFAGQITDPWESEEMLEEILEVYDATNTEVSTALLSADEDVQEQVTAFYPHIEVGSQNIIESLAQVSEVIREGKSDVNMHMITYLNEIIEHPDYLGRIPVDYDRVLALEYILYDLEVELYELENTLLEEGMSLQGIRDIVEEPRTHYEKALYALQNNQGIDTVWEEIRSAYRLLRIIKDFTQNNELEMVYDVKSEIRSMEVARDMYLNMVEDRQADFQEMSNKLRRQVIDGTLTPEQAAQKVHEAKINTRLILLKQRYALYRNLHPEKAEELHTKEQNHLRERIANYQQRKQVTQTWKKRWNEYLSRVRSQVATNNEKPSGGGFMIELAPEDGTVKLNIR